MNRLIKIALVAIVAAAIVIGGYYLIFLPHYCDIELHIGQPARYDKSYFCSPIVTYTYITGLAEPFEKEFVFDFVLTKEVY